MLLDRRREGAPLEPQEFGAATVMFCFLAMDVSGRTTMDEAGLDPITLEDTDEFPALSQGAVEWRRRDPGLICMDAREMREAEREWE